MGWLGPVPLRVVGHAACPVVAVPTDPSLTGPVVVGVDGYAASTEAVAFAFEEASRTGAELMAVHAFPLAFGGVVVDAERLDELHERARRELSEALAGWREKFPDVRVLELVSAEHPERALRLASETASLMVLGTHGRGVLGRFVLGSVVAAVLRVADCPVAVVSPTETDRS
jgi:nucleotide-binding universal stress UspA family protein